MSRWLARLCLMLALAVVLVFGMLNGSLVELDLLFTVFRLPLGVALMIFLVIGVAIGGGAMALSGWRQRARSRGDGPAR